jgi:hypothetical protein
MVRNWGYKIPENQLNALGWHFATFIYHHAIHELASVTLNADVICNIQITPTFQFTFATNFKYHSSFLCVLLTNVSQHAFKYFKINNYSL